MKRNEPGVTDLHCLHVWSLTLGRTVVSAHIKATDPEKALAAAHKICEAMGVAHSTIQVRAAFKALVHMARVDEIHVILCTIQVQEEDHQSVFVTRHNDNTNPRGR